MSIRIAPLILAALTAGLVLSTPAAPAEAHDFEPEREVMVQAFDGHLDVMVAYREAPGVRTDFFLAQFGYDFDGRLGELFDRMAGRAILPRVLAGLEFEVEGETPETGEPDVKIDDDGPLEVAAYVRYDLDELEEDEDRTVVVRARDRSTMVQTAVLVYPGGNLELADDEPTGERPEAAQFDLYPGDEYDIVFRHPP